MKVIRVLEYDGSPEWLERTLALNAVKRTHWVNETTSIRELVLGRETRLLQRLRLAWRIVRGVY